MKLRDIFAAGSSPLARGLRHLVASVPLRHRIIPARAGFTQPAAAPRPPYSDHPRSRGVYKFMSLDDETLYGSSPLARGLRGHCRGHLFGCRIIPARAGFTPTARTPWRCAWDHPRSRGVYTSMRRAVACVWGSSPLARGLLGGACAGGSRRGIIPARAGFTPPTGRPGPSRTDHPRSRGVYNGPDDDGGIDAGSSPLARGLQLPYRQEQRRSRIIPARAGFTA